jgi:hypothetical protein
MYLDTFLFSKKKLRRSTFTCINENKVAFIPSVQNGELMHSGYLFQRSVLYF